MGTFQKDRSFASKGPFLRALISVIRSLEHAEATI
jgi:hypothetical protein